MLLILPGAAVPGASAPRTRGKSVSRRSRSAAWPRRVRIHARGRGDDPAQRLCEREVGSSAPGCSGGWPGALELLGHVSRSVGTGAGVAWLCDSTLVGRRPAHWYQPSSSSRGCVIKFAGVCQRLSGTKVPGPGSGILACPRASGSRIWHCEQVCSCRSLGAAVATWASCPGPPNPARTRASYRACHPC